MCRYALVIVRILISKTLAGTYEGGYTYVFEMCCYRTLDNVANYNIYKLEKFFFTLRKVSKTLCSSQN